LAKALAATSNQKTTAGGRSHGFVQRLRFIRWRMSIEKPPVAQAQNVRAGRFVKPTRQKPKITTAFGS
jgi:hypothetical protein